MRLAGALARAALAEGRRWGSGARGAGRLAADGRRRLREMRENVLTVPNGLSLVRVGLTPVMAKLLLVEQGGAALGLFVLAGATDVLDGYIARRFRRQRTVFGSVLDPFADKLLVTTLFLTLTYTGAIPIALTSLVIARDVGLVSYSCYVRYITLDPPKTVMRFFNVAKPTARVIPTLISKVNTAVQLGLIGTSMALPVFGFPLDSQFVHALWYLTAVTTITSGLSYVLSKNTIQVIKRRRSRK